LPLASILSAPSAAAAAAAAAATADKEVRSADQISFAELWSLPATDGHACFAIATSSKRRQRM